MAARGASDRVINRDCRLSLKAGGGGYVAQFYSPANRFKKI